MMKTQKQTINCPSCGTEIDVNDVLSHQIEETLKSKLLAEENSLKQKYAEKEEMLHVKQKEVEELKKNQDSILKAILEEEKKKIEKAAEAAIRIKLEADNAEILKSKDEELNTKSEQLRDFNKMKADFARMEREKKELKETLEAENEHKLNTKLEEERQKIKMQLETQNEFKVKELEKKLEVQQNLTKEMQRKHDQGSMQLQGEVMELAIEEFLALNFPLDTIDEIKKGASGADCLQTVNTFDTQNCGTIYYESKRAKNFAGAWIEKFKNDIREKGADIGVLVTDVLPTGMERMGFYQGIYICKFDEFKGLASILRQSLITISAAVKSQENKGDKMVMLYNFLAGTEFRLQMEGIIEGFQQMETDLNTEKRAMMRSWKQREKQIQKVINNTVNMYGSIKGIGGNAVQTIEMLEIGFSQYQLENTLDNE